MSRAPFIKFHATAAQLRPWCVRLLWSR